MKKYAPVSAWIRRSLTRSIPGLLIGAAAPLLLPVAGCSPSAEEADPLAQDQAFVPISRTVATEAIAARRQALADMPDARDVGAGDDFYLAINKKELGQRYFLSAYMKQYFPGAVAYGAANSLGTRVVTMRVQNGKLFVFDVTDGNKTSDTFDPTLVIEAYPLVTGYTPFDHLPGAKNYVLIDPAAGRNRFSILIDAWSTNGQADRFSIELSFLQRFRRIKDGVTYEQVFTGYSEQPDPFSGEYGEPNQFRTSGTLGVAWRRYSEGPGYKQTQIPEVMGQPREYYFRSNSRIVPNTGELEDSAIKWNFVKGQPIEWVISDHINFIKNDPTLKDIDVQKDLYPALAAGITNWNQVLGFEAFKVRLGTPADSFGDDDTNYLIFDEDASYGAAYADWRLNPNTGEIRGASVYFSKLWLDIGNELFEDDPNARGAIKPRERPRAYRLLWDAMPKQEVCSLWPLPYRLGTDETRKAPGTGGGDRQLTKKTKVTRYVTHVVLHEIGHTLGLRHNFMGSLAYEGEGKRNSSSVMEYVDDFDAVFNDTPGSYDAAAIKLLYGLSDQLPADRFCTDGDTRIDPNCATYDIGKDPLNDDFASTYNILLTRYLEGTLFAASTGRALNGVLKYVRSTTGNTAAIRLAAWNTLFSPIRAPIAPAKLMIAGYGQRADGYTQTVLNRAFLDAANFRSSAGGPTTDPPLSDAALVTAMLADLRGVLLNLDSVRSFNTRRIVVDILKKLQITPAFAVLREAREALALQIPALTGENRALAEDLLSRIDRAISPYFNN